VSADPIVAVPTDTAGLVALAERRMMRTYPPADVVFVRGSGAELVDADGGIWLDLFGGIAVTGLGHAHPAVTAAVTAQVATLVHTSNLFLTAPALGLAERLAAITGWDDARVFLAQCGATANEAALKLARRHGKRQHPDKVRVVTLEGSFHGRTMATLEATGQPAKHVPFEPLMGFVDTVPSDDAAALTAAVGPHTCAVLLEVVQGEGGVRPLDDAVLAAAREACDRHGALLIVDEVQTGMGRTGTWFAYQGTAIVPDVITTAKALANGLPIGACIARGAAADALGPGDHATTFGGNPVTCAAANAVIDTIAAEGLLEACRRTGEALRDGIAGLSARHPVIAGVRGRGLLLGVELHEPVARALERELRRRRVVTGAIGEHTLRLAPALTLSREQVDLAVARFDEALGALGANGVPGEGAQDVKERA
jgi:acetylornithine/N-succinyldiaminopimelate aminotransferase